MPHIIALENKVPKIHPTAYIAPNATIIGDVEIGEYASVWFGCVLRGDCGSIRIGARSNIQDLTCVHMTDGLSSTIIGEEVTVGHSVILHGCIVHNRALIGMGSILLDNVEIGAGSVVGAGSLVTPRSKFADRMLILGRPAKAIREVNEKEAVLGIDGATHYVANVDLYKDPSKTRLIG